LLDVHRSGNSWQLAGSLDAEGGRALLREIERWRADVRIDGSRLQRIDGAGLTALAVARQQCRAEGRTFAVIEVAPGALRDLRVGSHLLELFGAGGAPADDDPELESHRAFHPHVHQRLRHDGKAR
jgi:ABC-type transporter Mla MlaB component